MLKEPRPTLPSQKISRRLPLRRTSYSFEVVTPRVSNPLPAPKEWQDEVSCAVHSQAYIPPVTSSTRFQRDGVAR